MKKVLTPDICVLGAGSAGLSVAAAAAAFGVDVVLIEKGKMGGDCLNYGCVPSKALLAAAKHAQAMRDAQVFGIKPVEPDIDFEALHRHVHGVIAAIEPHDSEERFTGLGVHVIRDQAFFRDPGTVEAGGFEIQARRFVVATGSSPFVPPIEGLDKVPYLTNETVFDMRSKMGHLVVVGGGPIGMEMAQAHCRLGSRVTVLEGDKILAKEDPELKSIVVDKVVSEGVSLVEGALVKSVSGAENAIEIAYEHDGSQQVLQASHILIATGRTPNVSGLQLESAGIEFDNRGIKVTPDLRTSNKKVYAIGDVTGGLQFTHVAGYHAGLVIRSLLFRLRAVPNNEIIPWVTYTDPEIGQVGLSEAAAMERFGQHTKVLRWSYAENDRAQTERKTTGLIKIVSGKRGRIVGVSIVGAGAGEMLNFWSLALSKKMKLGDITGYISPYPTMTEIGKRAAVSSFSPLAKKPFVRWVIGFLQKFG